ncbi:ABC transporter substrate-binding protein [Pseudactinotalea suaedae]|jgi:polar amino acid transport system substrate-binding protein|uniref:ABC transporter substrate-binding protein n=1 Tax=Pseudactinotalea suaedae TaxID=1524924 RepID=UPI0012E27349|nr:ABC transporter substrate-binding protein [Pseudactinotalea suaedae]
MSRTGRFIQVAVIAATASLAVTACGGSEGGEGGTGDEGAATDELELVTAGTLTVCSEVPYPPFEIEDSSAPSGYSGFDIDLAQAIAEDLGLELSVQDVSFDGIQSGTAYASGQCDMGASAITITEERQANLDFSDPYYDSLQSLLVAADSGIQGIDDLAGQPVAVQATTTGEAYAQENAPEAELISFPGDAEMWPALQAGQVVAILQDLPVNVTHAQDDPAYVIVEEYDTEESYGFAFGKDSNPNLLAAVNESLQTMRDDGSYQELYDSYFSTEG